MEPASATGPEFIMFKTMLNWIVVSAAYLTFVLFGTMLPAPVYTGVYFVVTLVLIGFALLFFVSTVLVWLAPESSGFRIDRMDRQLMRPRWYWALDVCFDFVLIGIMAAQDMGGMALAYVSALGMFWLFRITIKTIAEMYQEDTADMADLDSWIESLDLEDPISDLPEYMRD